MDGPKLRGMEEAAGNFTGPFMLNSCFPVRKIAVITYNYGRLFKYETADAKYNEDKFY